MDVMTHEKALGRAIDVGCGANPVIGCDAYIEPWPDQAFSRSGGRVPEEIRDRLTITAIEKMPFEDGAFDFSYCRHVLEHVEDPFAAIHELQRISKAGYIETPSYWNEIAFGKPYHKWLVLLLDGDLVFIRKNEAMTSPFGDFLVRAFEGSEEGRSLRSKRNDIFINALRWSGTIPFKVIY